MRTVRLPSGITVEEKHRWLPANCPKAEEHDPLPADFDPYRVPVSRTHVQAVHEPCGLWMKWLRR